MTQILELSDRKLKFTMIKNLRDLIGKGENVQRQLGNVKRERKYLRKNQKKMLEITDSITELKTALKGSISRLGTTEEGISELENRSTETS